MKKIIYTLGFTLITLLGCANDSEEDLIEVLPPIPEGEKVTYDVNIKSILDNNCVFCHANPPVNGANTPLNTFEDAVNGINNNNLFARISRQAGEGGAMPLGGPRLPQNLIDLVEQWRTDGLLEN